MRYRWARWLIGIVLCCAVPARADVMLQGFYWDVPSPAAGSAKAVWWWDRLAAQAEEFKKAGFTAIWIPPVTKAAVGGNSVGYDPFDDYDLGAKDQRGTIPTRYGTREQLARCVAMMRAAGLDVYIDLVLNHRNGDPGDFNFAYKNAYGELGKGRFAKRPKDFHPNVPQDPEVPLGEKEYQFGRDVAHVNGDGGRTGKELLEAADWLTHALDIQGYRLDYVKGISAQWLRQFLQYGAMKKKFVVGEYYDGNLDLVAGWVRDSMRNGCRAFDFPLRGLLHEMCARGGGFDMARLERAGFVARDSLRAVTFVENHDTDRESPVVKGKMLAYAYILTTEGYPSVFYRDYSTEPGCYRLKRHLDKLLWIHEKIAKGEAVTRYKDDDLFIFERTGGKRLLVALSDSQVTEKTIRVRTGFGAQVRLRDYTGHKPDVRTDANGEVTLTLPSNRDGNGYVCYSVAGIGGGIPLTPKSVTQEFLGVADLDIRPASPGIWTQVGRIWVGAGKPIQTWFRADERDWTANTRVVWRLLGPDGKTLKAQAFKWKTPHGRRMTLLTKQAGWQEFQVTAMDTPPANRFPGYRLRVTYTAPTRL